MPTGKYTLNDLAPQQGQYSLADLIAPPKQGATISARPGGAMQWLQDLEADIRYGGKRTAPGKVLDFLGAPGINAGVPEAAANDVAGPLIGPVTMAQGVGQMKESPWQGLMRTLQGAGQTTFQASAFMSPAAGEIAPVAGRAIVKGAKNIRPSIITDLMKQSAGRVLNDVEQAANTAGVVVDPNRAGQVALRIQQLSETGNQMPQVIRKFLSRTTNPDKGPLTFREARDFYSNASRLSADEFSRLTPKVQRLVGEFTGQLQESLTSAAGTIGQGEKYDQAINAYAKAFKVSKNGQWVMDNIIKPALKAGVIGGGGTAGYDIYRQLTKR